MSLLQPARPAAPAPTIKRLPLGEPIEADAVLFRTADDLRAALGDQGEAGGRRTVVLYVPPALLNAGRLEEALAALPETDWLVLTWNGGELPDAIARGLRAWRRSARGKPRPRTLLEPRPARAVIGAMQWLRAGDTFLVLWPGALGLGTVAALVEQGRRWREAWEAPEDGEFHFLPPAALR